MPRADLSQHERPSPLSPRRVMREAWAIFRRTYNVPAVPFRSVGRPCFAWALRTAWAQARHLARLARSGAMALGSELATIAERLASFSSAFATPGMLRRRAELVSRETELRLALPFAHG